MPGSALSAADIRAYVYNYLDVDITEIATSVLNIFMEDGFNEIVGFFDESPTWLHVEYTFSSVASQQAYDLDTTSGLTSPTPLMNVSDVRGPRWVLQPVSHRQVRAAYRKDTAPTGTPTEFSVWGRSLYLWVSPSSAESYTITGVRQPTDWVPSNSAPDCPVEFHRLIADYTLARAYIQQDDAGTGEMMLNAFNASVRRMASRYFDTNDAQPVIVSGGRNHADQWRTQSALGPLIFDWV